MKARIPQLVGCCCAGTLILMLASCVMYEHTAVSKSGNTETDKLYSLGGTTSQRGADGSSLVHDHQASFRDAMSAAGIAIGAYQAVKVNGSNNALSATQNTNAASVTKNAADNATAIELGKQVPVITTPPQVVTFPK